MLKAVCISSYYKTSGRVFVYGVTGTTKELAAFKDAQGAMYRENETDQTPLYFLTEWNADRTRRSIKKNINLLITQNGRVVLDDQAERLAFDAQVDALMVTKVAEAKAQAWVRREAPVAAVARTTDAAPVVNETPEDIINQIEGAPTAAKSLVDAEKTPAGAETLIN